MKAKAQGLAGKLATGAIAAGLVASAVTLAYAQDELNALGHAVHQRVMTEGAGGDFAGEWEQQTGAEITW